MKSIHPLTVASACLALLLGPAHFSTVAQGAVPGRNPATLEAAGEVSGRVINLATGAFLEGARVELEGTDRSVFTDVDGHFEIRQLPVGERVLLVSYSGLDTLRVPVAVAAGEKVTKQIALTSDVYALEPVVVKNVREGQAAAITLQRIAPNVKNVVATDAFGNVADGNVAEFLKRLPGVAADGFQNEALRVSIRGINPNLNSVTLEGMALPGAASGVNRQVNINEFPIGFIETIEVTKAPTPDMDGNSIGGSVNLRPKTVFDSSKPESFTFSVSANARVNKRNETTPSVNLSYSNVYGSKRNIGILLTGSYSGNYQPVERTRADWEYTEAEPAYMQNFSIEDVVFHRNRSGLGARIDYKFSERSIFYLNAFFSQFDDDEDQRILVVNNLRQVITLDAAGIPVPANVNFPFGHPSYVPGRINPNGTRVAASIMPGYTGDYTESKNAIATYSMQGRRNKTQAFTFKPGGRHRLGSLELDYSLSYAPAENQFSRVPDPARENDVNGQWSVTVPRTDWIFDARKSASIVDFQQTGGPDISSPENWTIGNLTHVKNSRWDTIYGALFNAKKNLEMVVPTYLKTGFKHTLQDRELKNFGTRYSFTGTNKAQFLDTEYDYDPVRGKYPMPAWPSIGTANRVLFDSPEQWIEDSTYRIQQSYNNNTIKEGVSSGYIMGSVRLGKLSMLGGLRVERTEVEATGRLQDTSAPMEIVDPLTGQRRMETREEAFDRGLAFREMLRTETAAQRAARLAYDAAHPEEVLARLEREYSGITTLNRHYQNVLPGIHFKYEPWDGLLVRTSYTMSIGRPNFGSIFPNTTIDYTNESVSQGNAGLKAQTSDNFDLSLEYYFEPVGLLSASFFLKEISNFIYNSGVTIPQGDNNGFDGLYGGWTLRTAANGGFARVRGLELNYQQQYSFLPGWLSGFGSYANYTHMETFGNYGEVTAPALSELAGFKPKVISAGISYSRLRFTGKIHANYVGRWLTTYAANPAQRVYREDITLVDLNLNYKLNRNLSVFCDVINLFDAQIKWSRGYSHRGNLWENLGARVSLGVSGRY
jgi:TonB-dependent receptor